MTGSAETIPPVAPSIDDEALRCVQLRGFSVCYPDFDLRPLSFSVTDGERVALLGPNGSGKTTLMRAIAGRDLQYSGEILLNGRELRALVPEVRQKVGFLAEKLVAYGWMSVAEHLRFLSAFYPGWDDEYATTLLARLGISPKARMGTLSKGTAVKLSFVAAQAHRPPLLLLDEPTSGLDPVVRRELLDVVREAVAERPNTIVVFSTHILEDVEFLADRVIALHSGGVTIDSPIAALRSYETSPIAPSLYALIEGRGR
ncbi:MAG: ABC transporter ATP-binding protein [Gemmatimonadaceae bacterium]